MHGERARIFLKQRTLISCFALGALIHPKNGQKCRNFKIVQIRPLIARSKNLAKADLMSPPPELFIFSDLQIALFRWVLPGGPS
jgi:hypothetical protein